MFHLEKRIPAPNYNIFTTEHTMCNANVVIFICCKTKNEYELCQNSWILSESNRYPRVDKDLLMFAASFKRSPSAPELFCLVWIQLVFVKARKGCQFVAFILELTSQNRQDQPNSTAQSGDASLNPFPSDSQWRKWRRYVNGYSHYSYL